MLRYIKIDLWANNCYMDYEILIDEIENDEDYCKLKKIHEMSVNSKEIVINNFNDIRSIIVGVGRLI